MIQQKPDSVKTKIENVGREQTNYVTVRKVLDNTKVLRYMKR